VQCQHATGLNNDGHLTIRNVDAVVKERLRVRAAQHSRSMEAEARSILSEAVVAERDEPEPNLAEAIRRHFAPSGGVDLKLPPSELATRRRRSSRDPSSTPMSYRS
jgi:antitoxin FitA